MLINPAWLYQEAQAAINYSSLGRANWGTTNRDIHYYYDQNGSCIKKIEVLKDTADPETRFIEKTVYVYNLQNRLEEVKVTTDGSNWGVTTYKYNDDGIRVKSQFTRTISGVAAQTRTTTYLVDSYNHTGYAQTLEEQTVTTDYVEGVPQTPVTETTTYVIGDDIIAQNKNGSVQYLLYDGHGSTRQLARWTGSAVAIDDTFSYDGYGVLLQNENTFQPVGQGGLGVTPGVTLAQATNLLYAGEHFDTDAQQYYLRARYYNPLNGRFNQLDPYSGNTQDPQSLHKYLYCHANPINSIDPSGEFLGIGLVASFVVAHPIISLIIVIAVVVTLAVIIPPIIRALRRASRAAPDRLLAEVGRYMESNGWHDVGPDMGPDNALAHTVASMIAVGSGIFDSPEDALEAFQNREQGEALPTQMDRANNILGNSIAQQRGDRMDILKNAYFTWIEEIDGQQQLVRRRYHSSHTDIENLRLILTQYGMADLNP